jgi:hypothetical protein
MDLVDAPDIDRVVGDPRGNVYGARILGRGRDDGRGDGRVALRPWMSARPTSTRGPDGTRSRFVTLPARVVLSC